MELYYNIVFFIFGTIFGSFFNVVGVLYSKIEKNDSYRGNNGNDCQRQKAFHHTMCIFSVVLFFSVQIKSPNL